MSDSTETGGHPETQTVTRSEGAERPSQSSPEFFRLPKAGGDPYFGLGRSYYYEGEKLGYWRLVRIRQRGKLRGVTLVPYDVIAAYIRKQAQAEPGHSTAAREAGGIRTRARFDKTSAHPFRPTPMLLTYRDGNATTGGRR